MTNVLVVDDDTRIIKLIEAGLRGKNYRVSAATTGLSALNAIARQMPDVVVLDVNMPDLTGLEVCERLRSSHDQSQLAVLFLSGGISTEDKIAAFEAGADDYLTKPFRPARTGASHQGAVAQNQWE